MQQVRQCAITVSFLVANQRLYNPLSVRHFVTPSVTPRLMVLLSGLVSLLFVLLYFIEYNTSDCRFFGTLFESIRVSVTVVVVVVVVAFLG